jgi:hypothetical protein
MKKESREFICATSCLLDYLLDTLTHEEQHELLDVLAAIVEERLDTLVKSAGSQGGLSP